MINGKDTSELERLAPLLTMLTTEYTAMVNIKRTRSLWPSESYYMSDLDNAINEIRDRVSIKLRSIYTNEVDD